MITSILFLSVGSGNSCSFLSVYQLPMPQNSNIFIRKYFLEILREIQQRVKWSSVNNLCSWNLICWINGLTEALGLTFQMHSVCVDSYPLDTPGENPAQIYLVTTLKVFEAGWDGQRHNSNIGNHYTTELGSPGGTSAKELACQCRRHGFNPWVGTVPWRRAWQPHSSILTCHLENPMDRGAWWATVHRVSKNWTRLKRLSMHTTELGASMRPKA